MTKKRKRLVVLVPGFQEALVVGSQLNLLKNCIRLRHPGFTISQISCQTYTGYRIEGSASITEVFEADWQSATSFLSSQDWFRKLTWGLRLVGAWASPKSLIRAKDHKGWFLSFAIALAIMGIWWISTLLALVGAIGDFVHHNVPVVGSFLHAVSVPRISALNRTPLGHSILVFLVLLRNSWPLASAVLVLLGVSISASVDVADLFRRYLDDADDDNGLPTRTVMRSRLTDALDMLADASYDEVLLVGHSFGVLVALDAIAEGLAQNVNFISLGGFLAFLAAENPWAGQRIRECLRSSNLAMWKDYYSTQDHFAAAAPVPSTEAKFKTHTVNLRASYWQSTLGKSHSMYFRNDEVQDAILAL
ncbi:MAG: hypothetical protein JOZ77_08070 [Candidatus Eremiobacteraeota bacterium]|nr:hypothetical protein [Candidatus Eremiobacteraeota bacterium]